MERSAECEPGFEASSDDVDISEYSVHHFIAEDAVSNLIANDYIEAYTAQDDADSREILSFQDILDFEQGATSTHFLPETYQPS